jgi:hypothetical protein
MVSAVAGASCQTGVAPGARSVEDVTASGLSKTAVGKNKCNPKTADRPFVVEWDATDMSSFESRAANDVVFVKYEGCDLKVLDGCVQDSVKGAFGSYQPVEWTSGSLEVMDINDEGELYAKLPLGASSLGGRIEGGEKFHMEYFVSGTRSATRESMHRPDLAKVAACKGATHFVYAFNLGAFALGAASSLKGSVGGSAFGFGAGAKRSTSAKVDKQGGVLASCRGETAKETDTCRVPIRLTLREISEEASADAKAAQAPDTPESLNLAGKIQASNDRERKAGAFFSSATAKLRARDGKGCLDDLDQHDQLDPRPEFLSTNPGASGIMRAMCIMLAGQCAAGKALYRKSLEKATGGQTAPDALDANVDSTAANHCQGGTMTPREQLLKTIADLHRMIAMAKPDSTSCKDTIATIKRLAPLVKATDDPADVQIKLLPQSLRSNGTSCYARAGDCDAAWAFWQSEPDPLAVPNAFARPEAALKAQFQAATRSKCSR